ncbi:MAG TPA: YggS family pyridoxal phosphate-dependent enzyme, partial [Acidobacteriota bacterium]|nr:YggS family pyridoxal phosphate-dependent enzyme [Acidobacteriota bacterium]
MSAEETIRDNVQRFIEALQTQLAQIGRPPESVTVVAVSKTMTARTINAAARAGLTNFGENRLQEAQEKIRNVTHAQLLSWHFVGHLQTNKAKDAVALFDLIQSVDRLELAEVLDQRARAIDRRQDVLIQVNTTAEPQKSGCRPDQVDHLVSRVAGLANLRVMGLMTIGPMTRDETAIAQSFKILRRTFERASTSDLRGGEMRHCSMGMTDDWQIALAEGSNMLRIGRAIFGEHH